MPEELVAQATVELADESDAYALSAWLNRAGHFRGLVDVTPRVTPTGDATSTVDVAVVVIGSGMLALLVSKIYDWIALERDWTSVKAVYSRPGMRPLEIEVDRSDDRAQLIERVRRSVESGESCA